MQKHRHAIGAIDKQTTEITSKLQIDATIDVHFICCCTALVAIGRAFPRVLFFSFGE